MRKKGENPSDQEIMMMNILCKKVICKYVAV